MRQMTIPCRLNLIVRPADQSLPTGLQEGYNTPDPLDEELSGLVEGNKMDEGLLELFEFVKQDFLALPLDEFTEKVRGENNLYFYHAFAGTPLFNDWNTFENLKNTVINESFTPRLREDAYKRLKYIVDEIIAKIKSGSVSVPKKRIAEEVVNAISDPKIKQICVEL